MDEAAKIFYALMHNVKSFRIWGYSGQMLENAEEKNSKYRHLSSSHGYSSLISWAYQNPWTLDASIGR